MRLRKTYRRLRFILGDQLNINHSWFETTHTDTLYVIAELKQEAKYVNHHIQKLCAFFLAMEHFAKQLDAAGHHVLHLNLDETASYENLQQLIVALIQRFEVAEFSYQQPDEFRLAEQLKKLKLPKKIAKTVVDSEHFMLPFDDINTYIKRQQHNRMEVFYRKMRSRFDILMDGSKPEGGKWNYDSENRAKLKASDLDAIPQPLLFSNDIKSCLNRIRKHRIRHIGETPQQLLWPVTRQQSLQLLNHFCKHCLPLFGKFQDAMSCQHPHQWTLYHSRLSFALNSKLLHPKEVMTQAITAYEAAADDISLSQIEGFIRQILGWREYVRCVYWANMPTYYQLNHLDGKRDLPGFFWSGDTEMACMKQAIKQSLDYAYAHHIQRLMITGNFCLLTGIEPSQVDAWYLGIYVDAIEWVELPNTRGMSQFADGGWVATKPYSAGGNYINKMSDYCKSCHYDVKQKVGEQACPFNSLYWHFMLRHRDEFGNNPRIGMVYRSWDKQQKATKKATMERAEWCLEHLEEL